VDPFGSSNGTQVVVVPFRLYDPASAPPPGMVVKL
jgi:hypothetical protein